MRIEVELFAAAREAAGASRIALELPDGATVADAAARLAKACPGLAGLLKASRFAVNDEYAAPGATLSEGDRFAVIPPVSGGRGGGRGEEETVFGEVTDEPLDAAEVARRFACPSTGAVVLFVGVVRNENEGEPVEALEYEAHPAMAAKVLREICGEVRARYGLTAAGVVHRVGRMRPGETSVVIATASPHREEAYAANREILERLKKDVPIWKREFRPSSPVWLAGGG